jgi:hypothetical protein
MKNKLKTILSDYRKSSWHLVAFVLGLATFLTLAGTLPESEYWGADLPGGGHLSDLVMLALIASMIGLWFTDSRRRYRSNRDTLYAIILCAAFIVTSLVTLISMDGKLYQHTELPGGGFEVTASGLVLLPVFIVGYLIALPIERYIERQTKPVKGIESKKIFK